MGADIGFYIQQKNEGNEWENILLYRANGDIATIWRRGWDTYQELRDNWLRCTNNDYFKEFTEQVGWEIEDDDAAYWATLAKIKYFAEKYDPYYPYDTEEEVFDVNKFYKGLVKDVDAYLDLTDNDWIDIDRIRVVALVSY